MKEPLIFEIKGNSLDDGPGIRTVIFMKGCPLSCVWCHNPEGMRPGQEHSFDSKECIACQACVNICSRQAITNDGGFRIDRLKCSGCLTCVSVCPTGALDIVGKSLSVEKIVSKAIMDKPFFETSGGGVTLSGGEPTLFMDFCSKLVKELKGFGINILLETCGMFDFEAFIEKVFPWLDTIFFDIKLFEGKEHRRYCGVDNAKILDNFIKLSSMKGIDMLPRVPLVPNITDTKTNLSAIADFLVACRTHRVRLLAYNPLWPEKLKKSGRPEDVPDEMKEFMRKEHLAACREIFIRRGIEVI